MDNSKEKYSEIFWFPGTLAEQKLVASGRVRNITPLRDCVTKDGTKFTALTLSVNVKVPDSITTTKLGPEYVNDAHVVSFRVDYFNREAEYLAKGYIVPGDRVRFGVFNMEKETNIVENKVFYNVKGNGRGVLKIPSTTTDSQPKPQTPAVPQQYAAPQAPATPQAPAVPQQNAAPQAPAAPQQYAAPQAPATAPGNTEGSVCESCGEPVTKVVADFCRKSKKYGGRILCRKCQDTQASAPNPGSAQTTGNQASSSVCVSCGAQVGQDVINFCLKMPKFNGKVYCRTCQNSVKSGTSQQAQSNGTAICQSCGASVPKNVEDYCRNSKKFGGRILCRKCQDAPASVPYPSNTQPQPAAQVPAQPAMPAPVQPVTTQAAPVAAPAQPMGAYPTAAASESNGVSTNFHIDEYFDDMYSVMADGELPY